MIGIRREVETTEKSCGLLKDMMEACAAQVGSLIDFYGETAILLSTGVVVYSLYSEI
jgi:hypothetical protein